MMAKKIPDKQGKTANYEIGYKKPPTATQFKKGYDPRRNLKGKPQAFDQLRALAQDILQSEATNKDGVILKWNGTEISFTEFILLGWALDKKQQEKIIEIAFGKVPNEINLSNPDGSLKPNTLTDDQRLANMKELASAIAEEVKKKDA